MAEHATRATRLTLGDKEKELGNIATGVLNLSDAVRRFDETLQRTLRGWAAAVDDARDAIAARDAVASLDAAATPASGDVSTGDVAEKNETETEETENPPREENERSPLSDEKDENAKKQI
jgi:hypothetical protein